MGRGLTLLAFVGLFIFAAHGATCGQDILLNGAIDGSYNWVYQYTGTIYFFNDPICRSGGQWGPQCVRFVGNPHSDTIRQTITTVPGATYTISAWMLSDVGSTSYNEFKIIFDGVTVYASPGPSTWTKVTVTAVATTATTEIKFNGFNPNAYNLLDDVSVSLGTALTGTFTKVDNNCHGSSTGSATFTLQGGATSPYTIVLSDGTASQTFSNVPATYTISSLAAGSYTATLSDSTGCTAQAPLSVTITQPSAPLVVVTSKTDVHCNGAADGTVKAVVTGGTAPYSYSWTHTSATTDIVSGLGPNTYAVTVTDVHNCPVPQTPAPVTVSEPAALTWTYTPADALCSGGSGSAAFTLSGGTVPYTITYTTGGSSLTASTSTSSHSLSLSPNTYTLSVTDSNSCSSTSTSPSSVTITAPNPLVITPNSPTPVTCPGGSDGVASVTVSGGTPTYTYSWSGGSSTSATNSGIVGGAYTVTVQDSHGCSATSSTINVATPNTFVVTPSHTDVLCHGAATGSASVAITGGTGSYIYSWSNGATTQSLPSIVGGVYTVQLKDTNNCPITSQTITVVDPPAIVITKTQTDVSCHGLSNGVASVSVAGGTGSYTYLWDTTSVATSISSLAAGSYHVSVTDANSCIEEASFTITQPDVLTGVSALTQQNALCNGGTGSLTVQPIGGAAPFTYSWSPVTSSSASLSAVPPGMYAVVATDNCGATASQTFTITQSSALTLIPQQTDVACFGTSTGSAAVFVSGGAAPYTYSWSPSGGSGPKARNLIAGTYTVTVTDTNGCIQSMIFVIDEPSALAVTPTVTQPSCKYGSNGAVSLSVAGGSDRYLYQWVPTSVGAGSSLSNIKAGTYAVIITDMQFCSLTQTVVVNEPTQLTTTGTQVNIGCHGGSTGSATVVASGGVGSYTYSWSPSGGSLATATGLTAGIYVVTVTDSNGCTATQSFSITEPAPLTITPTQVNVGCHGQSSGSATAQVNGGSGGYTYAWSPISATTPTASGLAIGTYVVTVTDSNSCTATQSYTITEPAVLSIASSSQVDVLCHGSNTGSATVTVAGGTMGYTYSWTPSGQTTATASNLVAGAHSVTVTDANGCTVTQSFTITEPAVLTLSSSQVNVSCNGGNSGSATVSVSGGVGSYTYKWSNNDTTPSSAGLEAGEYSVTAYDGNQCTIVASFNISQPDLLSVSVAQTDNYCNKAQDGSASLDVTGGTAPYSYLWQNGANTSAVSQLAQGQYHVSITDFNACSKYITVTINEPEPYCVHGTCNGLQSCKCAKGWTGPDCSTPFCDSCLHNGTCVAPFTCSCVDEWTGPICNITRSNQTVTTYVVKLVQTYNRESNVSASRYVSLLANALNISVDSINSTEEIITADSNKRAPKTLTKLTCTISLKEIGISQNRTQEMVLEAANSTSLKNYLEQNGSEAANNVVYIHTIELQTVYIASPPPPSKSSNNNRKLRLGLGIGLGLGVPITAAIVVTAVVKHRQRRTPGGPNI